MVAGIVMLTGVTTFIISRLNAAKQEGRDKQKLDNVVDALSQIQTKEVPRINRIEVLTEKNAQAIENLTENVDRLADLHKERSERTDRMIDRLLEDK